MIETCVQERCISVQENQAPALIYLKTLDKSDPISLTVIILITKKYTAVLNGIKLQQQSNHNTTIYKIIF